MRRVVSIGLLGLTCAAGYGAWAWWRIPLPFRPMPTSIAPWMTEEAEEAARDGRAQWFRQMHRAPPDLDPVAIERANGERQVARRAALARARAAPAGTWTERGSENQAGRMHGALYNDDGTRIYAISADGGVWRADRDAKGWTPIGDNLYGGAQSLAVLDDDAVLVATDWGSIHRSDDDGVTWVTPTGLEGFSAVRRIARATDGSGNVFVVGGPSGTYGVYRSTDNGQTFTKIFNQGSALGDLFVPRDGGSTIYELERYVVSKSEDGGSTWTTVGESPAVSDNLQLVGSEAGAPTLYAAVSASNAWSLYRSDDAGASWVSLGELSDFYGEVQASIVDPSLVAWGGVDLSISRDGGATSAKINTWDQYYGDPENMLHADIMGMLVQPTEGGEVWWIGCDGGLYRSTDSLESVKNLSLSGLRVSQYYSTLTSRADPTHVHAGAQDQGYQVTQGGDTTGERYSFVQGISGDYGHLTSSDGTHERVFSTYPGFILVANGEESVSFDYAYPPSGEIYAWIPPVVADPDDKDVFYFLGQSLYRYEHEKKVGWSYDKASDEGFHNNGYDYLSALAFAPTDHDRVYAATSRGETYTSADHGLTWTEGGGMDADSHYLYGNAIAVSPTDPDTAWLGGSGYGQAGVFRTTDGGAHWDEWSEGLPDTMVYSLAVLSDGSERVFAGTETAAYMRGPDDAAWVDITALGSPIVPFWSAEAIGDSNVVRFGTYGRGIWDYTAEPYVAPQDTGDTGEEVTDPPGQKDTGDGEEPGGCGCQAARGTPLLGLPLLLLGLLRRRRA